MHTCLDWWLGLKWRLCFFFLKSLTPLGSEKWTGSILLSSLSDEDRQRRAVCMHCSLNSVKKSRGRKQPSYKILKFQTYLKKAAWRLNPLYLN